jgi:hypothetical protein
MKKKENFPSYALAMVLGLFPATLAFAAIFSDIHFQTYEEAMVSRFIVVASVYFLIGLIFGVIWSAGKWFYGIWLGLPLMALYLFLFVVFLHSLYVMADTPYNLAIEFLIYTFFFGGGIGAACLGSQMGSKIRSVA